MRYAYFITYAYTSCEWQQQRHNNEDNDAAADDHNGKIVAITKDTLIELGANLHAVDQSGKI